ncbi:MAG TPA: MCP four helix bundle domain-containing protein, partial [Puia sp.]
MSLRLKTKLSMGLLFLFIVILLFGVLGLFYINRLSNEGRQVLQNNYESLMYCNRMLSSLENINVKKDAAVQFRENLQRQQVNITEIGEKEATDDLTRNYHEMLAAPSDTSNYPDIRRAIYQIQELNEMAIQRKSAIAQHTAENAKNTLAIVFTILSLVAFTFIFNLPGIISDP